MFAKRWSGPVAAAVLGFLATHAPAADAAVSFSASLGNLAAGVTFEVLPGSKLEVVLTNTSAFATGVPAEILTAVFFSGADGLTPGSATLAAGSTVINTYNNTGIYDNQQPPDGNVGGEWAYTAVGNGAPSGATSGLSSSGLGGLFGGANLNGPNLQNPLALDGMQYGIVSASTAEGSGNGGMTGNALIRNAVRFVLDNYTGGAAGLGAIDNVYFQYGTAMSEPTLTASKLTCVPGAPNCGGGQNNTATPEPASMALLGAGLAGLAVLRRRRRVGKAG